MTEISEDRLHRQQAALAAFGNFASHEADLEVVFAEAVRVCAKGLASRYCKISQFRREQNDLLLKAGYGWPPGNVGYFAVPASRSTPQGRAFVTGQPAICADLRAGDFDLPRLYTDHGIISTIYVMIRGNGMPWGVLGVEDDEPHTYDEHDIDFLTGFANVLAAAVALTTRTAELQAALERAELLATQNEIRAAETALLASELRHSLDEKETLAEELQHRVRNSLQLIHAMLSKDVSHEEARAAMRAAARRVSTLAQVYEHLLGSGMTRTTDFARFGLALCDGLRAINARDGMAVTLECEIDPLLLDLDVVTALGLIIAEVVTNCFEHAFPGGIGSIRLTCINGDEVAMLVISDNGVGFDQDKLAGRNGVRLIKRLIQQVYGGFEVITDAGTTWTIRFPTKALVDA